VEGNTATVERPEYLTVEEVSRLLRVSAPTIYRRCADGQLPHIRVGDHGPIRISTSQLERLYDQGVSDDGSSAEGSFAGTDPAERRGTQAKRGQSNPPACWALGLSPAAHPQGRYANGRHSQAGELGGV
jgi:excisionase family DNA binding protein